MPCGASCYGRTSAMVLSLIPSIYAELVHLECGLLTLCSVLASLATGICSTFATFILLFFFILFFCFFALLWATGHLMLHNDSHTTIYRATQANADLQGHAGQSRLKLDLHGPKWDIIVVSGGRVCRSRPLNQPKTIYSANKADRLFSKQRS